MAISLTEKAAEHVQNFIEKRGGAAGLRLAVKTSGCSGLAYVLEFVDDIEDTDEVFESAGVKIVVDKKSLIYLDGNSLGPLPLVAPNQAFSARNSGKLLRK